MQFEEIKTGTSHEDEKISKAENAIAGNPHDFETWNVLLRYLQEKSAEEVRLIYERMILKYPNYVKVWKAYIEQETKAKCYNEVEKLFQRCLLHIFHIDIWRLYLNYIEESKANEPQYKEKMVMAYEFAIDKIGMDINSYSVWVEYVNYLKSVEAVGTYAENQKIAAVRKVYQKGILNPMVNVDLFWKDYCNFENSINPQAAKKLQEDRNKDYMHAKRVAKEFETVTKGIIKNAPSVSPCNTPEEIRQVELWKKYIQWEKSNPLKLQEADQTIITKRVMFAYEQCFLCLGLHPDVWIEAATFLEDSSKMLNERGSNVAGKMFAEEASSIYERALSMGLKNCLLIYFAYADLEESRLKYDKVHSIYKKALELKDVETTLVYIQYMRFARRAEGIESSRAIFKQAREDPRTKYHVYVTAARMEHCNNKENGVALRIFELAFKKFGHQQEFVKEFLDYSMNVNDSNNTRVLYEKVISSGVESLDVWNKFVEFESNHGDLPNIFNTERRRLECFGKEYEGREMSLIVDRYKFLDLMPCSSEELQVIGYKQPISTNPSLFNDDNARNVINNPGQSKSFHKGSFYAPEVCLMTPFIPNEDSEVSNSVTESGSAISFRLSNILKGLGLGLPKPTNFKGPFARVDMLMEYLSKLKIPSSDKLKSGNSDCISDSKKKKKDDEDDEYDDGPQIVYNNPFQARHHNKF